MPITSLSARRRFCFHILLDCWPPPASSTVEPAQRLSIGSLLCGESTLNIASRALSLLTADIEQTPTRSHPAEIDKTLSQTRSYPAFGPPCFEPAAPAAKLEDRRAGLPKAGQGYPESPASHQQIYRISMFDSIPVPLIQPLSRAQARYTLRKQQRHRFPELRDKLFVGYHLASTLAVFAHKNTSERIHENKNHEVGNMNTK